MISSTTQSSKLAGTIRRALGTPPTSDREPEQWRAFEAAWRAEQLRTRQRPTRWTVAAAAAALTVCLVGVLAGRLGSRRPSSGASGPSFVIEVGSDRTGGREGALILAPERSAAHVRFRGGSELSLSPLGRARILAVRRESVRCRLDAGRLEAVVVKEPGTTWAVEAGPFVVAVVGTRFDVEWSPERQALTVNVSTGRVRVAGPGLSTEGEVVEAGRSLSLEQGRRGAATTASAPPPGTAPVPGTTSTRPDPPGTTPPPAAPGSDPSPQRPEVPTRADRWRQLAGAGEYHEIRSEALRADLALLLGTLSLPELWLLADACRYTGHPDEGALVLESVRSRFPGSEPATRAAFLLGRYHADAPKRSAVACRWFQRYLDESPKGPLVEEALGRLMETCSRAGQRPQANKAARAYLERFPRGAYRRLAETIWRDRRP